MCSLFKNYTELYNKWKSIADEMDTSSFFVLSAEAYRNSPTDERTHSVSNEPSEQTSGHSFYQHGIDAQLTDTKRNPFGMGIGGCITRPDTMKQESRKRKPNEEVFCDITTAGTTCRISDLPHPRDLFKPTNKKKKTRAEWRKQDFNSVEQHLSVLHRKQHLQDLELLSTLPNAEASVAHTVPGQHAPMQEYCVPIFPRHRQMSFPKLSARNREAKQTKEE